MMNSVQSKLNSIPKNGIYSLKETAKLLCVTKSAISQAIRLNRLNATKCEGKWTITRKDLIKYEKSRYSRDKSTYLGELVFDKEKGEFSISEAAKFLKCSTQHLYYACRNNKLKSERKNKYWVININDIENYQPPKKKKKRKRMMRLVHGF